MLFPCVHYDLYVKTMSLCVDYDLYVYTMISMCRRLCSLWFKPVKATILSKQLRVMTIEGQSKIFQLILSEPNHYRHRHLLTNLGVANPH